jgi:hypothetical protein
LSVRYGQTVSFSHQEYQHLTIASEVAPTAHPPAPYQLHVVGHLLNLTIEEQEAITQCLAYHAQEYCSRARGGHFAAHPPYSDRRAKSGRRIVRFSCTGMVMRCYEAASISLVDWKHADFPHASLEIVKTTYCHTGMEDPKTREHLGLVGEGPWPLVFPSYLFHSFSRSDEEIRTQAYVPADLKEIYFDREPMVLPPSIIPSGNLGSNKLRIDPDHAELRRGSRASDSQAQAEKTDMESTE